MTEEIIGAVSFTDHVTKFLQVCRSRWAVGLGKLGQFGKLFQRQSVISFGKGFQQEEYFFNDGNSHRLYFRVCFV